jgi:hypothetical protein
MIITIPLLIAAGIATHVVTGRITGTAVYLTAGNADVITGDQIKTEGGLHILELGHMEPWVIAMMCATVLIGMGTCGTCCHRKGKSYVRDKEAKLRNRALGREKELVDMKAHGAEKLLEDVQTYHDMHEEIVVQKMHQVTPPSSDGVFADKSCGNPQCRKGNCCQPRHNTVGFCSATQTAKIHDDAEGNFAQFMLTKRSEQSKFADPLLLNERSKQSESQSNFADPLLLNERSERSEQSERSELSIPMSSRTPSPPRQIAARTPSPPMVIGPQKDPFASNAEPLHIHMMRWQVDNDAAAEDALIHYGSAVTQEDRDAYTDRIKQDMSVMKNDYSKQHEQKILRKWLEEQRQRRIFSDLQQPDNKRKLRIPVNSLEAQLHRYAPVPMGLPHTSEEWLSESNKWHEKSEETRTIDVFSPKHNKTDEYYFEGSRLFQVQRTDESYDREDRDLAASLRKNAAAAAATVTRK